MERYRQNKPKQSRERRHPNKKWTSNEEIKIIEFMKKTLQDEGQIEKPTARVYWTRFQHEHPEINDANCDLLRNKAKNIRKTYQHALKWKNENGHLDPITIDAEIRKRCIHFDDLREITSSLPEPSEYSMTQSQFSLQRDYPAKRDSFEFIATKTEKPDYLTSEDESNTAPNNDDDDDEDEESSESSNNEESIPKKKSRLDNHNDIPTERPSTNSVSFAERHNQKQDAMGINQRKLILEEEKFIYHKFINEKRLKLKEKKFQEKFKYKMAKLEQKKEIRLLELEHELKIAKMAYDINGSSNKPENDIKELDF